MIVDKEEILKHLNDIQRIAVEYCDGPSLVVAGAGSGKTRVLTHKVAWLLYLGYRPWNILAITFTNKAAHEMKDRVAKLVGEESVKLLNMGTFHSVFAKILRAEAEKIGYKSNYTIYDQTDSRAMIKSIIKDMQLDERLYTPSDVAEKISLAKNKINESSIKGVLRDIYYRYRERCRQANVMDFDDLLLNTYLLFTEHEDVRKKYVDKFHYVLIDEYQDTNALQHAILWLLTQSRQRICAVGDDAQSIYGFRGADINNILNFASIYSDVKVFKMERNYRSTRYIVQTANSLICHNTRQIPKVAYSIGEYGERVELNVTFNEREEANLVAKKILSIKKNEGCKWNSFAILYRTRVQSRHFEESFAKYEIPYKIYGSIGFYQRKDIKDILAYFRLVVNNEDETALLRIINYPTRGIGQTTITRLSECASSLGKTLWEAVCDPIGCKVNINKGVQDKITAFRTMIQGWTQRINNEDAFILGRDIITKSGIYKDILDSVDLNKEERKESVDELVNALAEFVKRGEDSDNNKQITLLDYIQNVILLTNEDDDKSENERVSLMTMHASKGLEFDNVFVVGLEEGVIPSAMSELNPDEIEEERRLLYVTMTRAKQRLMLSWAENRMINGMLREEYPSRFIEDLDPNLINNSKNISTNLSVGDIMIHEYFGRGRVIAIDGQMENTRAIVAFDSVGVKQLIIKYAKYKILKK